MENIVVIAGKHFLFQAARNPKIPIFELFIRLLTEIYNEQKLPSKQMNFPEMGKIKNVL